METVIQYNTDIAWYDLKRSIALTDPVYLWIFKYICNDEYVDV